MVLASIGHRHNLAPLGAVIFRVMTVLRRAEGVNFTLEVVPIGVKFTPDLCPVGA